MNLISHESKPSLDSGSIHESPRTLVSERYHDLLVEQESMPDKVFISGYSLREFDPDLVVLDEKINEHPRVSRGYCSPTPGPCDWIIMTVFRRIGNLERRPVLLL
jgi:hypothetical protein